MKAGLVSLLVAHWYCYGAVAEVVFDGYAKAPNGFITLRQESQNAVVNLLCKRGVLTAAQVAAGAIEVEEEFAVFVGCDEGALCSDGPYCIPAIQMEEEEAPIDPPVQVQNPATAVVPRYTQEEEAQVVLPQYSQADVLTIDNWMVDTPSVAAQQCVVVENLDLDGVNIPGAQNIRLETVDMCCDLCVNTVGCGAWVYIQDKNFCYLKRERGNSKTAQGMVAGVVERGFTQPTSTQTTSIYMGETDASIGQGLCGSSANSACACSQLPAEFRCGWSRIQERCVQGANTECEECPTQSTCSSASSSSSSLFGGQNSGMLSSTSPLSGSSFAPMSSPNMLGMGLYDGGFGGSRTTQLMYPTRGVTRNVGSTSLYSSTPVGRRLLQQIEIEQCSALDVSNLHIACGHWEEAVVAEVTEEVRVPQPVKVGKGNVPNQKKPKKNREDFRAKGRRNRFPSTCVLNMGFSWCEAKNVCVQDWEGGHNGPCDSNV